MNIIEKKIIGINIGGTKCSVVTGLYSNDDCTIITKEELSTLELVTPENILARFDSIIDKLINEDNGYSSIGISCGGPLDNELGIILGPPNLIGWERVEIVKHFTDRYNIPCFLQNDANACALAEWKVGSGKGYENVIFLTFGTGMGAGIILNNRLYNGTNGMAGEIGHMRVSDFGPVGYGKSGSFEGFCSGGGIKQLTLTMLEELSQQQIEHVLHKKGDKVSALDVFTLAKENDPMCMKICQTVGQYLGKGLSVLIDLLNPQAIVIGSIFTRNYDMLYPIVTAEIDKETLQLSASVCKILPAKLDENIGDYAALVTALY